MEMNILYRQIRKEERDQLISLNKQLIIEDFPLPSEEEINLQWDAILSDKKMHCLVAENNEKIIASCILIIVPNLTRGAKPFAFIENVITDENYRKKGIGRNLLNYALAIAWEHDCYKVMLLSGRKDEATLQFYEKSGFKRDLKTGFVAYSEDFKKDFI